MANGTKINTDIWGAESSWIDVNNPPELQYALSNYVNSGTLGGLQSIDAKLAYLPKSSYSAPSNEYFRCSWRGAFLGKQYNPEDEEKIVLDYNSPVPFSQLPVTWGIGKDSAIANPIYVLGGYRSGTATEVQQDGVTLFLFTHDLYRDIQKKTIPFCFSTTMKNTTSTQLNYQNRNYELPAGAAYINYNGVLGGQPLMSFNYQKIVVYPVLIVGVYDNTSPTGISGIQECTISNYFDGANPIKNTKPLILSIIIKYWYMGTENQTANGRNQFDRTFFSGISGGVFYEQEQDSSIFMYSGTERLMQSVVKDGTSGDRGYQSIVSSIVPNGVIAGGLGTLAPEVLTTIIERSHVDEENRAWIVATQTNPPLFRTAYLNGKFKVHAQQYKNPNSTYTNQIYWCTVWDTEIDSATKDDILKEVAYLGFWFSEDQTIARTGKTGTSCDSSLMHIPVFDNNGVTTGEWKSGTDAAQEPNAEWNNPYEDNPYKPGGDDDDGDSGDITSSTPPRYSNSAGLNYYVCTETNIYDLLGYLNGTYLPTYDTNVADFKGTNPQEYIVSCQKYPFELPHITGAYEIKIGRVSTGIDAYPLVLTSYNSSGSLFPINSVATFSFGSINVPKHFNDFRDYLSRLVIQLPFIGSYDLDPKIYIGNTLSVDYVIDYNTGSVAALLYRNELCVEVHTGTISISAPFFASNMGAYQNTLASLQFGIEQSKIKQISGIASTAISMGGALAGAASGVSEIGAAGIAGGLISGTSSMASGLLQQQQLQYQIEHTVPSTASISTASPGNAFLMDDRARLLIYRPRMLSFDPDSYAKSVGYACAQSGKLGSFAGYTVAAAIDLDGVPATAPEKVKIKQLLQAGIYI